MPDTTPIVLQQIDLDIIPGKTPPIVHVSEYDTGRNIVVNLFKDGYPFGSNSIESYTVKVEGSIGKYGFSENADWASDGEGVVVIQLTEAMTAIHGRVWTKIKLIKSESMQISTCGFWMDVDRAGVNAQDVIEAKGFGEQIQEAVNDYINNQGIGAVRYDEPQSLSSSQKEQARSNIGAGTSNVTVDPALSVSGAAADAKVTGDFKNAVSEVTKNLFDGEYTAFSNMELIGGKIQNTATDTRDAFGCVVRFRNGSTVVTASDVKYINTIGRNSFTVTPVSNGDNIMVLHNGRQRNLSFTIPFDFIGGTAYTISFDVDNYDVQTVGGLVLSDIQIEVGDTSTEYAPHITAVDYIARSESAGVKDLESLSRISITENDGYFRADGSIVSASSTEQEKYTEKISVRPNDSLSFEWDNNAEVRIWAAYGAYDVNGNWLGRTELVNANGTSFSTKITIPSNVYNVAFCYRTYGTSNTQIKAFACVYEEAINGERIAKEVKNTVSEIEESLLYEPSLPTPSSAWIRYSNGEVVASNATNLYVFTGAIPNKIKAFLTSDTNVLCAIAFYSSSEIGTESYMSSDSVDFASGTHNDGLWYETDVPDGCAAVAITTKKPSDSIASAVILFDIQSGVADTSALKDNIDENSMAIQRNDIRSQQALFTGRFKPCYDHLFVSKTGNNIVIPHQSLYHVRLSRRLGYNTIEANVAETKDGVYVVNHLSDRMFNGYFHHVDGTTDISEIKIYDVTWDWIVENVRYNSQIEKYRTRPCRLEEFLGECKQQNIIPFLGGANIAGIVNIANQIMGKDNYIAYSGNRTLSPSAIIYHWVTKTTKAEILEYCESIGKPFIYGMSNPTAFSDNDLKDIVDTLHENGYWIGVSYADNKWYKYQALGFDFNGTQGLINRIDSGNLHNINSLFSFDGFEFDGATEANGVLTFSTAGNLYPKIADTTYELCGIDVEIWFEGEITFYAIGEFGSNTGYTSDGSYPVYVSVPIINGSPKWHIVCTSGTVVKDIKFSASVF